MNVAIVTNEDFPTLTGGELRFFEALKARGIVTTCAVWNDDTINWSKYTHVILRLCWDYHLRLQEFLAWLDHLEKEKINVYNPTKIIRWNTDKSYLLDLEKRGVAIPTTRIITSDNIGEVQHIIQGLDSNQLVVKPCVGAAAYKVKKFANNDPKIVGYIKQLLPHSHVLIQEFIPEITGGEISAIFFDNKLSHTVIKTPQKDDFRSNHHGHIESFELSEDMKDRLRSVYTKCAVDTLHARIDVVDTGNQLVLIELELVDAELFLEYDDRAAGRFVDRFLA